MSGAKAESGTMHYLAREVVGVFSTPAELDRAVEQLGLAGVDRAAISVPGAGVERSGRMHALYSSARGLEMIPRYGEQTLSPTP